MLVGFVTAADELFDALASTVPWREERMHMYDSTVRVPRLLARFAQGEPLPHPVLDGARSALTAHYTEELGEPFVSAGLCLYRDGSDSVAWKRSVSTRTPGSATACTIQRDLARTPRPRRVVLPQ